MNVTYEGEAPASAGVSSTMPGVSFGISTRAVVESTAEAVGDMLGAASGLVPVFRRGVDDDLFYWVRATASYRVRLSPGAVRFQVKHPRPHDAAIAREWRDTAHSRGAQRVEDLWTEEIEPEEVFRRGMITHWSSRSRRNMLYALATLDHETWVRADWRLSMVTLTLPGDWLVVAPDGATWKRLYRRMAVRWRREFGWWQDVWKQEFQDRGAPHMHLMTRVPDDSWRSVEGARFFWSRDRIEAHWVKNPRRGFRKWLSAQWADAVKADARCCVVCCGCVQLDMPIESCSGACDCPVRETERFRHLLAGTSVDFGVRGTDPKRIAVYFLKHSSKTADGKEYQHHVPVEWQKAEQGPGRFWGIAGLGRLDVVVDLERWAFDVLKRAIRHWHRAQRSRVALARRAHVVQGVSEATRRSTLLDLRPFGWRRDRVLTDPFGGGWVLANDAPALLYTLAHWLAGQDRSGPLPAT